MTLASVLSEPRVTGYDSSASNSRDAADAPVSEVVERFFKSIVAVVPLERVEELHLFAPLRNGGVETGIAVIAARVIEPPAPKPADEELPSASAEPASVEPASAEPVGMESEGEMIDIMPAVVNATPDAVVDGAADVDDVAAVDAVSNTDDESPYAPEAIHEIVEDAIEESIEYVAEEPLPVERHTVYTARYRLVQKGPDRGKWEANVVEEADAPLITVEMVVRGVQRRAGDASDTTRFTAAQVARALRLPLPPAP